jgi:8-oxo-dGTP pyrophosphatase MutT (NUDIX family)
LLLFSPAGRLLLMRFEDAATGPGGWWCTVGGGVDEGEALEDAARRELFEETGHAEVDLGPVVWIREHVLTVEGEPRRLVEHYFLAAALHEEVVDHHWTELERQVVKALRWWAPEEIATSAETIFPEGLGDLLAALLRDGPPARPLRL